MATQHGYFSTIEGNAVTGWPILDYSPLMYPKPVQGAELTLWQMTPKVSDLTDTVLYWMEDANVKRTFVADATYYLTDGSVTRLDTATAGSAAAAFLRVGTLIRNLTKSGTAAGLEVCMITVVNAEQLTVVRGYGGTSGATTHSAGDTWEVIGTVQPESSTFGTPVGRVPVRRSNYTGIHDIQVKLSGTDLARSYYSVPSNWDYQVAGKVLEFQRELERLLLWSEPILREDTSVATWGSFGGIRAIISARGGSNINASFGEFSYASWDNAIKFIYEQGYSGAGLVTIVPVAGIQVAAYIHESAFRGEYANEATRGFTTSALRSTLGITTPLIASSVIPSNEFLILDMSRIKIHFMVGRELIAMPIEHGLQGQDYVARRLLTELSLELHNADTAHYWAKGVTYTVPSS